MLSITNEMAAEKAGVLKRKNDSNKTDYGKLLVCAGSYGMAGAAVMCGKAALRSGSGLVTYYTENEIIPILQISVPEAMCRDITDDIVMSRYDVIAIGPGLMSEVGERRLKRFIRDFPGTLVIDAQSLNVLAEYDQLHLLKERSADTVLTPHEGEMARLLGTTSNIVREDRQGAAEKLRELTGAVVVLKGSDTLIAGKKGRIYRNTTGNPGLATGGSGDVLTGMIASLAGQGMSADDAAVLGVFAHGLAGDKAAAVFGETAMTAMDVISMIPVAFKDIIK